MTSSLPAAIGPLSGRAITALADGSEPSTAATRYRSDDPLEHDLQLALFVLNELHYTGWVDVDDCVEWTPAVTHLRRELNIEFERRLRRTVDVTSADPVEEVARLLDLGGPSVSAHLRDEGDIDQVRESMILKSPYQGKEADPHTFAIPRLVGHPKRVLCDIQAGEYGVGHRYSHAELFANALVGLGLDPTPNAYIDRCGGAALATSNLVTLGGMHRRLRGVTIGQLALFEMDSVVPNQAMADCCDRLELDPAVRPFFHIHVLADTEHQVMARDAFLVEYPTTEPGQIDNLLLGMRAQSLIDHAVAAEAVPRWRRAQTALVDPFALTAAS